MIASERDEGATKVTTKCHGGERYNKLGINNKAMKV